MGVIICSHDITSRVSAQRKFRALVVDSHNVLPKIVPHCTKRIEFIEGGGEIGSIKKTHFTESSHMTYATHKINALDTGNLYYKHTMIDSDIMFDMIDSVEEEMIFIPSGNGCICKITHHYHVKEGFELQEEVIQKGKDHTVGLFKAVEQYLAANPLACA